MRDTTENLGRWRATCAFLAGVAVNVAATVCMVAYSELVRRRETGAVLLWAYARACRERTATQRRLARANLLRAVSARPGRTGSSRGDRAITIEDRQKRGESRVGMAGVMEVIDDVSVPGLVWRHNVTPWDATTWAKRHGIKATFIDVGKGK